MTSANFAAARKRVADRQRQRSEALAAQHRAALQSSSSSSTNPFTTSRLFSRLHSQWTLISGREGTRPAFRVGQVDAELLDQELLELLRGQAGEALKYYGAHLRDDWTKEIQLALGTILFKLTIWDHDASYGAALQNLRYCDARQGVDTNPVPPTKWQKALYGLLSVGGTYAWSKWEDKLLDVEGSYDEPSPMMKRLSRVSGLFSNTYSVAAFASFLVFLVNGQYRTLMDRILRLRLVPTTNQVSREVSFEYLNRQLVWHAFTEFLLFLLPLVGISRWKRLVTRAWRKIRTFFRKAMGGKSDDVEEDEAVGGELGFLPERTCAICYQDQNTINPAEGEAAMVTGASSGVVGSSQTDITNPYECIPCGCVYCFVCLAQRLEGEDGEGWVCLRCGEIVKECQPWSGDVLEEKSRPSSGTKSVTFADLPTDPEKGIGGFEKLDPVPVDDDEKEKELEDAIEEDVNAKDVEDMAEPLSESSEWARASEVLRGGDNIEAEDMEGSNDEGGEDEVANDDTAGD